MTTTTQHTEIRRSPASLITIALLFLLGITALGGGAAMVLGLGNESTVLPDEWLADLPLIDRWVIPGPVLTVGFGVGSLLVGYGMVRRPDWACHSPDPSGTTSGCHPPDDPSAGDAVLIRTDLLPTFPEEFAIRLGCRLRTSHTCLGA